MIIAQISDTHMLRRSADNDASAGRAESLRLCVADINRQGVDLVIHTGDHAHFGAPEEYAHQRDILADLAAPLYVIPGNRDHRDNLRAAFADFAYLPRNGEFVHYAVDDYPVRLVGLDSQESGDRKGAFCARRRAWLEETLAQAPAKPTVLFIHHPPFDIAAQDYVGGYRRPEEARALAALVAGHRQVRRLLCGHVHCLYQEAWAGTVATAMPSVAVDLRKEAVGTAIQYVLHQTSEDGDLVSRPRVVAA